MLVRQTGIVVSQMGVMTATVGVVVGMRVRLGAPGINVGGPA